VLGRGDRSGQLAYQLVGHGVNTFNVVAIAVAVAIAWLQLLLLATAAKSSEPWSHGARELLLRHHLLCHV